MEETVRQVGHLPELYEDARSEKYKKMKFLIFRRFVFGIFLTNRATIKLSTITLSIELISYLVTQALHVIISHFIS